MLGKLSVDRRQLTIAGIVLAVVLFVALNIFGNLDLRSLRLDLTEHRQFTLSKGTEQLLAGVKEPITLRLYVSRALRDANPFLGSYADRVHDLLRAYAEASGGRIVVEYIDPEQFSPEEDRAVGFGLEPVSLEGGASSGYLGIAGTNSTDDVDVLPVLSPEREAFLEYDLTRMVNNLANPNKPVVALVSSLPLNADPALQYRPWQVMQELHQFFDVRVMEGDIDRFGDDIGVLMLVHPQALSEKTQYAIDQFVLRGGKALVFLDPHSEAQALRQQQQPGMPADTASNLDKLLPAWGVDYSPDSVVGDPQAARQVSMPNAGRNQVVDYLPWLSLDRSHLAAGEVVTAELNRINLGTPGALAARPGATTTFTPLVRSSIDAMAIPADKVRLYPDPYALLRDYHAGGKELVMAARISGPLQSAFGDAAPAGVEGGTAHLKESAQPGQIIIVADTDLLDDRNWLSTMGEQVAVPTADNANLVANALDYLVGSEALMTLRGREVTVRPFTKVAEIRRAAESQYRAKEQELQKRLDELQGKLSSLNVSEGEDGSLLTEAQRQEIDSFRSQLLDTRRELRDVQLALRKDIERLRDQTRFVNIALVPLLVALAAIGIAVVRRVRYRRRFDQAHV
ncbi:MAG: GldG family protein [Geminicoccaceae bacterium]